MHEVPSVRRAGPLRWGWLAAFVLGCALPAAAAAQTSPDTIPRDTVIASIPPEEMAPDALPADSLMRSQPVGQVTPSFPRFPDATPVGFAFGTWEWGEEELAHYHGFTLLQLLQRVPGLTLARAGQYGAPVGVGGF
ncbi:MAG TPA: hypothetical protein VFI96_08240, partial [Longimicrobiaceae bacterium]|nr:hypothetical protein [Longimicrobiaceae bacterium]